MGDSSLLNTSCGFNRVPCKGGPKLHELSSSSRVIDTFSNHFSFNSDNKGKNDKIHLQQLDSIVIESSSSPSTAITVMDASIKNNVAMSISHTYIPNRPLSKTIHHSAFVTSTKAELFAIRCGIN